MPPNNNNNNNNILPISPLLDNSLDLEDYDALFFNNTDLLEHNQQQQIFDEDFYGDSASFLFQNATEEQKRHLLMALQPPIELTDVLPPPNHDDVQVQVMAICYMLLFLLGTCGNVAVLTTIYQMVRSRRANLDNTLIYMVVLSFVDFGVCLSLPFTVIDQILGFWMFGSTMCKLHAVLENFGKILSALIITAMSFDRFASVCHSEKRMLRSRRIAFCILIGMAIYALLALCPLLYNFEAREVILFQKATGPNKVTRMRIEKCTMMDMVRWKFTIFTCFLFVLCYLVPLFLVTFFYTQLLSKLHHHARQFKSSKIRSQIPLVRISLYTMAVACFYFICWTPFWVATAFAVYLEYAGEQNGQVPPVFVYFMYFIHALPFTNSAVNWILYGALNGQLQQRVRHGTYHPNVGNYGIVTGHQQPTNSCLGGGLLNNVGGGGGGDGRKHLSEIIQPIEQQKQQNNYLNKNLFVSQNGQSNAESAATTTTTTLLPKSTIGYSSSIEDPFTRHQSFSTNKRQRNNSCSISADVGCQNWKNRASSIAQLRSHSSF
uniref:G-protein coupled receptors family 1 profile domain-containing protein n=1 Tax=Meloidogyne enterolobii TaxID=390850 RepID=A0A6V7VGI8_MELEN|nr:unnamed protein product [Meloidogyne enterolobii]